MMARIYAHTLRAGLQLLLSLASASAAVAADVNVYALPYRLVDEQGQVRTLSEWRGRPTIVAMDHSTWSAICSSTARRLRAVAVAAERLAKDSEFVIIGLEPDKDTPATWQRYREERGIRGDNWHFLRASPADTPVIAAQLGVNYRYEYDDLVLDLRILRVAADGRIVKAIEGYDTDTEAFLE